MTQKNTDENPGENQELKRRMHIRILIPIILGLLVSSIVVSLIFVEAGPRWATKVYQSSIVTESVALELLSKAAGNVAKELLQTVANDLMNFDTYAQGAFNSRVNLKLDNSTSIPTYYYGARAVSSATIPFSQIPGYNLSANKSFLRTSWFLVGSPLTYVDDLNNRNNISEIPSEYQLYYSQWLTALPIMNTLVNDDDLYLNLYSTYINPQNMSMGFYVMCPLAATASIFGSGAVFNFLARPYYNQSTNANVSAHTVQFIYPYRFLTNKDKIAYTACINTMIDTNERVLMCADYVADSVLTFISTMAQQQQANFFIIEESSRNVIIFPSTNTLSVTTPNVSQAMFNTSKLTTNEQWTFDIQLGQLLDSYSESNFNMQYTYNGTDYLLSLSVLDIKVSNNASAKPNQYVVGLIISMTELQGNITQLKSSVNQPILIQIFVLVGIVISSVIFAHVMISWVSTAITTPINNLVDLLRRINLPSDGDEEEKIASKGKRFVCALPKIKMVSLELSELQKRFNLLKLSFQYMREAETASNDGDAIITYSHALNIYKELNSVRGIGTVYNNIAFIHFKQGNYYEAMKFYELALEKSTQEQKDFKQFLHDRKRFSDESSVAKVLKRASSTNSFSIDVFDKAKTEFDEKHSNTLYLLAQTKIALEQQQGIPLPGSSTRIRELLLQVIQSDREGERKPYRVILCLLDIAATLVSSKNYSDAEARLADASKELKIYESDTSEGYEDNLKQDYKIPYSILRAKYLYVEGKLLLAKKKKKEACERFTTAIECGKVYDPVIRKNCLKCLETIFAEQNMLERIPNLKRIEELIGKKNKDIVLVLDYSQSMGEAKRINMVVSGILRLFDKYIQANDRVGFIRFNNNCDAVFSLTEKKRNTVFMRKNIEDSIKPSGGTALYNAIYEAMKMLGKIEELNNMKWIVVLVDGDDDESRIKYDQLAKRLPTSNSNLIIIGLELEESVKNRFKNLCKQTLNGLYVESSSNDDLGHAFQIVSDIIYGASPTAEKITL